MNKNKLNFNIQNLIMNCITFKFQGSHCDPNKIAKYLFNLEFNSYQQSGKLSKPVQERMSVNFKDQFTILSVNDHFYWKGTLLQLSGLNAIRFDIYYSRENNQKVLI